MDPHCCPSRAQTLPWGNMNLLRKKSGWQPCLSPGPPAGQKLPWETCLWKRSFLISLHQLSQLFSSVGKEYTCGAGDPSSIPGSGRSPGEEISYPLQYPGLENSRDYTYSSGGPKELDTTERLSLSLSFHGGLCLREHQVN